MDGQVTVARGPARVWPMLAALTMIFILSHAFRTAVAIVSDPLAVELHGSAQALGAVARVAVMG